MSMKGLPAFMWLNADKLVAKAWSDALKGKAVSVPGWQYQLLTFIIRFAPRPLVRRIGMKVRVKQRR
jgi:short-subunit dehydrogenase